MNGEKIFYNILRFITMIGIGLVRPFRIIGRNKIPAGAAIICANHSGASDPFYMAYAVPARDQLCLMAKQELFKNRILAFILYHIGTFPVNRGAADMTAMKRAMECLKSGKKLGIFPEGTRTSADGEVSPKSGAIRLAEKMRVPIVPMYIPRKKKFFRINPIIVGEPIKIAGERRLTHEEQEQKAEELMARITELGAGSGGR